MNPATMPPSSSAGSEEPGQLLAPLVPLTAGSPGAGDHLFGAGAGRPLGPGDRPSVEGKHRPGANGREAAIDYLVGRIAELARRTGRTIGCAESVTAGTIARRLADTRDASEWFRGAVVAYAPGVARDRPSAASGRESARAMARGVQELLKADIAVAVSGLDGVDMGAGVATGTVFACVSTADGVTEHRWTVDGEPAEFTSRATELALRAVLDALIPKGSEAPVLG